MVGTVPGVRTLVYLKSGESAPRHIKLSARCGQTGRDENVERRVVSRAMFVHPEHALSSVFEGPAACPSVATSIAGQRLNLEGYTGISKAKPWETSLR